ncbi:MAG: cysteine--tRNA ligase [Candidatus Dormibacteria bacterium]
MLRLFDTRSREVRRLAPLRDGTLRMYSCGPTVYRSVHIGNLRTYLLADWIKRVARAQGWKVLHVKNITDVGHMRQEMAERGGDKVIAAALAAGKTPREIADHFEQEFHEAEAKLLIEPADVFPRATAHVPQMLELIAKLVERGLAYQADGTVYFDTASHPGYGVLSGNTPDRLLNGAGAEVDPAKRHPADFTLWRAADPGRQMMVWDSPYGPGFPGWHIECSAMSMAYLGEEIDLHTGGVDNIFPHHEDELAQSEGATEGQFVRHWAHGQHLLADGVKMAKSQGNVYTVADLEDRGFDPLAFRLLCAQVGYRTRLNFTLAALASAEHGLRRLRRSAADWEGEVDAARAQGLELAVRTAMEDDLDLPSAIAATFAFAADSGISPATRASGLLAADRLLGLGLDRSPEALLGEGPWAELATLRSRLRETASFAKADRARDELLALRAVPEDRPGGSRLRRATALDLRRGLISSPQEITDGRSAPDALEVSVSLVAGPYPGDLERCLASLRRNTSGHDVEYLVVDNDAGPEVSVLLSKLGELEPRLRCFHADHQLGEGAARNLTVRAARGRVILMLDTGVEAVGDCFGPVLAALSDPHVGAVGRWGARSTDLREFYDSQEVEVDAIDGYCLATLRRRFSELGFLDERFRFYRMLDFNFSFALRNAGLHLQRIPDMPVLMHQHRGWEDSDPDERDRLSRINFRRFYDRWHHRTDLLVGSRRPG